MRTLHRPQAGRTRGISRSLLRPERRHRRDGPDSLVISPAPPSESRGCSLTSLPDLRVQTGLCPIET